MAIYEISLGSMKEIAETTFYAAGLKERADLQRLLRSQIGVIAPGTLVISEEFGSWEDSKRRIDLLAVDKDANLVVIELKRTEDGGHMELQAIRYAAMISAMTFEDAVSAFGAYLKTLGLEADAEKELLDFLEWDEPDEERFAQSVRIILASADFSKEISTSVIWLNEQGLDIRCIRLKPYLFAGSVLLDVEQLLPLPEAAEYQVKLRQKAQREKVVREIQNVTNEVRKEFFTELLSRALAKTDLHANMSPSEGTWVGTCIGLGYSYLSYVIARDFARVELYINLGRNREEDNLKVFNALLAHKEQIEIEYGGRLDWQDLPGRQACRIADVFNSGGYRSDRELWPQMQNRMVDAMIRLDKALRPHLHEIKKSLGNAD